MFESEEVDGDYFTPVGKMSLASIFKKPVSGEKSDNETLKYTPPVLKPVESQEEPQRKPYETVYSCVFDAYLWLDNVYTNKGKQGCAVVKHNTAEGTQNFYSILLYDSNKTTLSSAIVTKEFEVTVKGNNVISYYDRYKKYWCLHGSENDIKKVTEVLTTCNVNIKVINEKDNTIPQENISEKFDIKSETSLKNLESDTDSSINRKTKASILSRMASMGQSVLPPCGSTNDQSSDSSDTNECDNLVVAVRHKPTKNIVKRNIDKLSPDIQKKTDATIKEVFQTMQQQENTTIMTVDNQIIPLQSSIAITNTSQDFNNFFTEQRIANSELRINMSRVTDKVDGILTKVKNLERDKNESSALNTDILQKLLREYESKIKTYEEILQNKDIHYFPINCNPTGMVENRELIELNKKNDELNNFIQQKDTEISSLNSEIKKLKEDKVSQTETQLQLQAKLSEYEEVQKKNNELLIKLSIENDELSKSRTDYVEQHIKSIMNDTFRAIEMNLDDDVAYLGGNLKKIIATVIKRVTIESLGKIK